MADEKSEQTGILVARDSAVFDYGGQRVRIIKGETTAEVGAAILKGREHLFEPLQITFPKQAAKRGAKQ